MPGFRLYPGADTATVSALLTVMEHDLGASPFAERALLVASEVCSNAAEHGAEPVEITWEAAAGAVTIMLTGKGPAADQIRLATLPEAHATRGRGLYLIQTLSSSVVDVPGGLRLTFI